MNKGTFPVARPAQDIEMGQRDDQGFKRHGRATGIPWTKPDPAPSGPLELDAETLANIRKAFQ